MAKKKETTREAVARLEQWIDGEGATLPPQEARTVHFGRTPAPKAAEKIRETLSESHAHDYIEYVIEHGPTAVIKAGKDESQAEIRILAPNQAKRYDDRVEDIGMLAGDDRVWNLRVFAVYTDEPVDVMVFDRGQKRPNGEFRIIRWTNGEYAAQDVKVTFAKWASNVIDAQIEFLTTLLPGKATWDTAESRSGAEAKSEAKAAAKKARAAKRRAAKKEAEGSAPAKAPTKSKAKAKAKAKAPAPAPAKKAAAVADAKPTVRKKATAKKAASADAPATAKPAADS